MGIRIKYEVYNTERLESDPVGEADTEAGAEAIIDAQFEKYGLKEKKYPILNFSIRKVWTNAGKPAADLL